jgi:putative thioredoxin
MDNVQTMTTGSMIHDADERSFPERVLARSAVVPVVVDFWAAWCAPCRALAPVLEREVAALGGRVELVKVDTDASPELASRYDIRGIPAVKAFRDGRVVDEFVGAQPPALVRAFLERLAPSPAKQALARAKAALESKQHDEAEREARAILDGHAGEADREVVGEAALVVAGALLARGDLDEVGPILDRVDPRSDAFERAEALRQVVALGERARAYGGETAARAALDRNPADHDARFALACALAASGRTPEALEELLEVIARSRALRDDARRAMVSLFEQPGLDPELVRDVRRRLQILT